METITREEAEKQINSIEYRCKGPWNTVFSEQKKKIAKDLIKDTEVKDFDDSITPRLLVNALLAVSEFEIAGRLEVICRTRCGYNFNQTILSNPFDGQERKYKCPKCGLEGVYTAPVFNIEG